MSGALHPQPHRVTAGWRVPGASPSVSTPLEESIEFRVRLVRAYHELRRMQQ